MSINNPTDISGTVSKPASNNRLAYFIGAAAALSFAITGCSTIDDPTNITSQNTDTTYPTYTPTRPLVEAIPQVLYPKTSTPLPTPIPIPSSTPTSAATSTSAPTATLSPTPTVQATVQITPTETATLISTPDISTLVPEPVYDYIVHNIFPSPNGAITQIRGLVMVNDDPEQPVNGVYIRVRGPDDTFCTISNPSGSKGPGGYDILLADYAREMTWRVSIVSFDSPNSSYNNADCNSAEKLSEEVEVETTHEAGVMFVEWSKEKE